MELLTCPACGCSLQVADVVLGRRVRCFACRHSFLAAPAPPRPPSHRRETLPPLPPSRPPRNDEDSADKGDPLCPDCGRRITWAALACPYCGLALEPEDVPSPGWRRMGDPTRRDYEPHRGALILTLGNMSLIAGGLSLCTFGIGAAVSVPLGILAWLMANRDLERMSDGRMDPRGRSQTQNGRTGAVTGMILGLIFAAFYALVYLAR